MELMRMLRKGQIEGGAEEDGLRATDQFYALAS
jgi:hypothetical protein